MPALGVAGLLCSRWRLWCNLSHDNFKDTFSHLGLFCIFAMLITFLIPILLFLLNKALYNRGGLDFVCAHAFSTKVLLGESKPNVVVTAIFLMSLGLALA